MQKLLAISIASASIAIGAIPAVAEVDAKTHKLCLEAKDYLGCVRAMTGKLDEPQRVIQIQSNDRNQCPVGTAYVGGGNCQRVTCEYSRSGAVRALGHDQIIAGKKDINGEDIWGCPFKIFLGRGRLRLAGAVLQTTNNSSCPQGEPEIGFNSTCQTANRNWTKSTVSQRNNLIRTKYAETNTRNDGLNCHITLQKHGCSYNAYLKANPSMRMWARENPEAAAKDRINLQSID